jgi:hypothetical protein
MKGKLIKINGEYLLNPSIVGTKLSLKNCQAIERGYDLDEDALEEMAEDMLQSKDWDNDITLPFNGGYIKGVIEGFQKALELVEHRLSKETEWQVEIEMEFVGRGKHGIGSEVNHYMPKRDADGCIILKRKT